MKSSKKRIIFIGLIVLLAITNLIFAEGLIDNQADDFFKYPVGSRPSGMGNAYTAIADDGSAPFYNPAGIGQISNTNISIMYNLLSKYKEHYQASVIWGSGKKEAIAITINSFKVDNFADSLPGVNSTDEVFNLTNLSIGFTAAYKIFPTWIMGGGAKYINGIIHEYEASSVGLDTGTMLILPLEKGMLKKIRAGISVMNLAASLKWNTESKNIDDILPQLRIGTSANIKINSLDIIGTIDYSQLLADKKDQDLDASLHFGAEAWYKETLVLRAGLNDKDVKMGASIKVRSFRFDYAYIPEFLNEGEIHKLAVDFSY